MVNPIPGFLEDDETAKIDRSCRRQDLGGRHLGFRTTSATPGDRARPAGPGSARPGVRGHRGAPGACHRLFTGLLGTRLARRARRDDWRSKTLGRGFGQQRPDARW
jgi:hypothetical protein